MNSFFQLNPEDILLVVRNGEIVLFDGTLYSQLEVNGFNKLSINNETKYVKGNLTELVTQIKQYAPGVKLPIVVGNFMKT